MQADSTHGHEPRRLDEMSKLIIFFCTLLCDVILLRGELWEEDLTSSMKIGLSTTGYKRVDLRCDPDHFSVNVTLEEDFQGVVYTRGSFNEKKLPCFKGHDENNFRKTGQMLISLKIPFHECKTLMDVSESRYTNTLVVQHDPDLIMPGDAAFSLDCAFVPEQRVNADLSIHESPFQSKITLVDADPLAEKENLNELNISVFSKSEKVTFFPRSKEAKDEL